jgi:hypothetical protein
LDLSSAALSDRKLLLLNFYDNLATRELNPIEKGMFLKRIGLFFDEKIIIQDFLPLLGLSSRALVLQIYKKMADLPRDQRQLIADKKISLQAVTVLLEMEMDIESRSSLFNWISYLNLNLNQQLQFIEFINDISIIHRTPVVQVLEKITFQNKGDDSTQNKPQQAKMILETLRSMRYPRLVKVENDFQQQIHKLNLPKFARIRHSPGFEDSHCNLTIDFKDGRELKQKMLALTQLERLEKLSVDTNKE